MGAVNPAKEAAILAHLDSNPGWFEDRILRRSAINPVTGCRLPPGAGNPEVQWYVKLPPSVGFTTAPAHRIAYMHAYGPIPEGLVLDHLCEVARCCRLEHLEAVTQQENIRRSVERTKARGYRLAERRAVG